MDFANFQTDFVVIISQVICKQPSQIAIRLRDMKSILFLFVFAVVSLPSCRKDTSSPSPYKYYTRVKTIIHQNCTVSCHSPSKGFFQGLPVILDIDTDIVSRSADIKASLADPTSLTNKRMPQGGGLSAADIATITSWYAAGGRSTD
jgi:hypothetical protein